MGAIIGRAGGAAEPSGPGEPGEDIRPYHDRGVLPLPSTDWADWLFDRRPAEELLDPPAAGSLVADPAPRPPKT